MPFLEFIIIWIVGMIVGTVLYCAWKNEFERNLIRKMEMRDATKEEQKAVTDYVRSISHRILDVPIPDNPTNGDVLKAVFPDVKIKFLGNLQGEYKVLLKFDDNHVDRHLEVHTFSGDWWTAPYKREVEE